MSYTLIGLVGVAASVLLMGRVQGRLGVWRVRQGALAVARAQSVGRQIPLVLEQGRGGAALLVKHGRRVGVQAGARVRLRVGREVGVGVRVVVRLAAGVRAGVGEGVTLELRGGERAVVGAQVGVCVVVMGVVEGRGHMAVCVRSWAVENSTVRVSVRA